MNNISSSLISQEHRAGDKSDTPGRAAFRVCEKLRAPLVTLTGEAGFHSLLSRALKLAQADAPWLAGIKIKADGTLEFSPPLENHLDGDEAAQAGRALVSQLTGLLLIFIGESLTLRLVQNIWPKAALDDPRSGPDKL